MLSIDGFGSYVPCITKSSLRRVPPPSFNATTDVLTITKGTTTTIKLQFDRAIAGEHFVLKGDGHGGADVSLATGAAVTLANLAHDVRNFVCNSQINADDRFMLAALCDGSGITMADPTAALTYHGGASHSYIDHCVDHFASGVFK